MERKPLTEDEKALVATAILYGPFPPKPQYLADCHHLYERGWLDRKLLGGELTFSLSDRGVAGPGTRRTDGRGQGGNELMNTGLLRQPGGFKGLFTGRVLAALRNFSVANREDLRLHLIRFDAADLGAPAEPLDHDHRVPSGVDQLDRFKPEPLERVDPVLQPRSQGLPAVDRPEVVERTLDAPVVDVLGEMVQPPIKPATGKGLVGDLHDLHVLLRHRPRSISRRKGGCRRQTLQPENRRIKAVHPHRMPT